MRRSRPAVWQTGTSGGNSRGITVPVTPKTILVVDDDPDVLEYASQVLAECGYRVLTAADGTSALSLLRSGGTVDLLFTDVRMPGLDGIEVARRARERLPALKVLFASGFTGGLCADAPLLKKPYRRHQLTGEVAAQLAL